MDVSTYDSIRPEIRTGDVFFFGGTDGFLSWLIRTATKSPVSHVGSARVRNDGPARQRLEILESTTMNKGSRAGVSFSPLALKIEDYVGNVWWCPLSEDARALFDEFAYRAAFDEMSMHRYDVRNFIRIALRKIPVVGNLFYKDGDPLGEICSEFQVRLLQAAHVVPQAYDACDVTPHELATARLYDRCVQIKGERTEIPRFNTVELLPWRASAARASQP